MIADLTRCVAKLTSSGADWAQRMKRLAARAPGLDIFTSGYVLREDSGWLITDPGREFLKSIEAPALQLPIEPAVSEPAANEPAVPVAPDLPPNVIQLIGHKSARRRRAAAYSASYQLMPAV